MVEVSRTQQDEGLEVATKRGAQVAIGRRHSSHQRMEIFKSPQDGDRRYLSSNPKSRRGTRCSANTPSLGFRVGRRMSGIKTRTVGEIYTKHNSLVKQRKELLQ